MGIGHGRPQKCGGYVYNYTGHRGMWGAANFISVVLGAVSLTDRDGEQQ